MRFLILFLRFWYDFIVGDCWQIAAGVALLLIAGIALMRWSVVPAEVLPLLLGGAIMAVVSAAILLEARIARRSGRPR